MNFLEHLKVSLNNQDLLVEDVDDSNNIMAVVIDFFVKNSSPTVEDINKLAIDLNVTKEDLIKDIYSLLGSLIGGGNRKKYPEKISKINPESIEKGMKVEAEHTENPTIQRLIAIDHLLENENYYDLLEKMEQNFKEAK